MRARDVDMCLDMDGNTALMKGSEGGTFGAERFFKWTSFPISFLLKTVDLPPAVGYPTTAVGYPTTAVGYPPTAVGYQNTAVGSPPTVVGCPSSAVHFCA